MNTGGSGFPFVNRCITYSENIHLNLQCNGKILSIQKWFVTTHKAKITKYSMLETFPQYLSSAAEFQPPTLTGEL